MTMEVRQWSAAVRLQYEAFRHALLVDHFWWFRGKTIEVEAEGPLHS